MLLAAGAALATMSIPTIAGAETLRDAINAAFANNPTLLAARARQDALSETPEQAKAGGRLTASVDAGGGYDRFGYGKGIGGTASASLPIWTGGRVGSAVRAAEGDVAAGKEGLRDTEASILEAVVSAYANLLYDQQAVSIAQADIALLDNQVADSRSRFKLGNATRTDVARLEAQRASAAATLAGAQTALASDAAQYRAVVGRDPHELAAVNGAAMLPATLEEARSQALAANPLFQQSQRIADADASRIDQARANGNPSLSLGAAYGEDADFARSTGRYFPVVANAGVTLHVPILTGGLVSSQVRQARAEHRAALSDVDAAGREAIRSAEAAWAALAGNKAQALANHESVEAADLALKGVRAEYAFGLRSTLDILVADESLRGAQLALARSWSDTLIAEASLLHAIGRLDDSAFQ
jgi:outer membrane protein